MSLGVFARVTRHDVLALIFLLLIFLLVQGQARVWDPLVWAGDVGNLPYQSLRMSWGDVIYRDFAAKNPLGVFLLPALVFRLFGPSMDALAFLVALQFTLLLTATYLVARRSAPRAAWVVMPLSLYYCLGSCGLLHHPWAGAVGLAAVPLLYDNLFCPARRSQPRWVLSGAVLGLAGLSHQVLLAMLVVAVSLYALATSDNRRAELALLLRLYVVAALTILTAYFVLALSAGDLSLVGRALESNVRFIRYHQSMAVNNPLLNSDLALFPPLQPGAAGLALRVLEILNRALTYFGLPLLALLLLPERRAEGSRGGWLSWLLLSGTLISLSAYPQFLFTHIRAFWAPFSFILVAIWMERRGGPLILFAALVSLLGLQEAALIVASQHYPVRFPVGTVYLTSPREARELQGLCDQLASQETRQSLLVYPYFPMAYFLFLRTNLMRIHEMYPPRLLVSTGVSVTDPIYLEGMRQINENPPLYAIQAMGVQKLFLNLEQMQGGSDPGNPLLEFMIEHYVPVGRLNLEDGSPWIVLHKRQP